MIRDRILEIQRRIARVCAKAGRDPKEIILVGVTKFASVEKIKAAIETGIIHIAENKVQEAQQKFLELKKLYPHLTCHFIGHLQTNKVKAALQVCDLIQSVDSLRLAKEIEKQTQKFKREVDILVQVKTSGEEQKFGVDPQETLKFIGQIENLKGVRVVGLMTMAPTPRLRRGSESRLAQDFGQRRDSIIENEEEIRECFRQLREIKDEAAQEFKNSPNVTMKYLSMGMTDDYAIAIEEGANMIRIGKAIFQ